VSALAPNPIIPGYSISKAAAFSLTQSLRILLAAQGVKVHAVLTGPVDTDMTRGFDIPKSSPESVARGVFDGVENGEEEIFPDPLSASMAESWRSSAAKALERQMVALLEAAWAPGTLLGRLPTLAQVADTAVFMASDRAAAVTGAVIDLTCGAAVRTNDQALVGLLD
jgi:NAD(P)-dependent dehydrogenase (short-subunit alcohol dehydrogenase family)